MNESLIHYCLSHGIELTRSRSYRKNDQAWIEQKSGAVVPKLLGYRRFQGIAAAQAITRLYGASRLFVSFFQPSFKLAEKHRQGAQVSKRYHPPQTPCERLLQAESLPEAAKVKLREVASALDPLKLLEEIRAVQAYLVARRRSWEAAARPLVEPRVADCAGSAVWLRRKTLDVSRRLAMRSKDWQRRRRDPVGRPLRWEAFPHRRVPWSSALCGSRAGDASILRSAAGSDGCRTPHRIPSALSWILSRQPSAYAAASPAGLAPRSHSAVDLKMQEHTQNVGSGATA